MDDHLIALSQTLFQAAGLAIDQQQSHFGMGYAERFDLMLGACHRGALDPDRPTTMGRGQEAFEGAMEAKAGLGHGLDYASPRPLHASLPMDDPLGFHLTPLLVQALVRHRHPGPQLLGPE